MVRHIAVTISNRTTSTIRISHQSYVNIVPALHTTLTKAIPTASPLRKLTAFATVESDGILEIKFRKSTRIINRQKLLKLQVIYPSPAHVIRAEKAPQKERFEVFQTIAEDGAVAFMVILARNMSDWMSEIPDGLPVSSLTLPGSHNSCALYGWPIGTCHTRPLTRQLNDGIRFIDIRLARPNSRLVVYHGIQPQHITFLSILRILSEFLKAHSRETVVVSIKQEDSTPGFAEAVLKEMGIGEPIWWLGTGLPPTLDGVRLPIWPDNSPEIWETEVPGCHVAVQDWHKVDSFLSIPKKSTLACLALCQALRGGPGSMPIRSRQSVLIPSIHIEEVESNTAEEDTGSSTMVILSRTQINRPTWVINYLSASSLFLGFPTIFAKGFGWPQSGLGIQGVNLRVARWLADRRDTNDGGGGVHGVVCLMDFYQSPQDALVALLVDCNF